MNFYLPTFLAFFYCAIFQLSIAQTENHVDEEQQLLDSIIRENDQLHHQIDQLNVKIKKSLLDIYHIKSAQIANLEQDESAELSALYLFDENNRLKEENKQLQAKISFIESNSLQKHTHPSLESINENKLYHTVKIGEQVWMTDNLNVTHFRNGDLIMEAQTDEEWQYAGKNKIPAWCYYDNNEELGIVAGKLYNWYAISDDRGIAPKGYRIPVEKDWKALAKQLGGEEVAAVKMKINSEWGDNKSPSYAKNNFAAIPFGWRRSDYDGISFTSEGAYWWSRSAMNDQKAWTHYILYFSDQLKSYTFSKQSGLAIRCVKGEK